MRLQASAHFDLAQGCGWSPMITIHPIALPSCSGSAIPRRAGAHNRHSRSTPYPDDRDATEGEAPYDAPGFAANDGVYSCGGY